MKVLFSPRVVRANSSGPAAAWFAAFALAACTGQAGGEALPGEHVGSVSQAFTDTDSDGMDDAWETTNFGNLSRNGTGDFDSDGMTDLEEYTYGFNPTVDDAFEDADGDRYPNVFELRNSANPTSAASVPSPTFVVNAAGGGTHTSVSAAVSAAASSAFQIVGIAPGVYTGAGTTCSSSPIRRNCSSSGSRARRRRSSTGAREATAMGTVGTSSEARSSHR